MATKEVYERKLKIKYASGSKDFSDIGINAAVDDIVAVGKLLNGLENNIATGYYLTEYSNLSE